MALFKKKLPTPPADSATPSLTPLLSVILADLALRAGERLVRRGVERGLLNGKPAKTGRVIRGATLGETVIGTVMAEVARRSVPGAILVGGGLLAKTLRDRRIAREAQAKITRAAQAKAALPKPDDDNSA